MEYNTCEKLELKYDKLSSGLVREYADHIDFYLNNFRSDSTTQKSDTIIVYGCSAKPTMKKTQHSGVSLTVLEDYNAEDGIYKLTVKHNGACDVTVTCSGSNERGNSSFGEPLPEPAALETPKQPELYRGPIIIEAEDMDYKNISNCVIEPFDYNNGAFRKVRGHSGNGFMEMGTNASGSLRHELKLKAGQEGDYTIMVRYTCTAKAGDLKVTVNGKIFFSSND